jgi:DNA polymerase-3 subunit epsilon
VGLLASVYLELIGGRQAGLELVASRSRVRTLSVVGERQRRPPRPHDASAAELAAHAELLKQLKEPIWNG